jgi:hypothetical protein
MENESSVSQKKEKKEALMIIFQFAAYLGSQNSNMDVQCVKKIICA